jgi:hypothetical protein
MVEDHRYLAIEITIEKVDHDPRRPTVRQCGEPAHIGQPDRRMDFLDIAAPDMPGEDPFPGVVPHIGIEQSALPRRPGLRQTQIAALIWSEVALLNGAPREGTDNAG